MKIEFPIVLLPVKARIGTLLAISVFAAFSGHAASEQWIGVPGLSATTNWTDAANWGDFSGFGSSTPPQTYYNQVQFTGTGANLNSVFSINNVLDSATGVAQMPIWELDYTATNGNYTTLIDPGVTLTVGVGNHGFLTVGADQLSGSSPAPANSMETIAFTGSGGTLQLAGSSANLWVGQGSPMSGDVHNVTLDLSGLDTFNDYAGAGSGNVIYVAYWKPNRKQFSS